MRKMLVFVVLIAMVAGGYYYFSRERGIEIPGIFPTAAPTGAPERFTPMIVRFHDTDYLIAYYKVPNTENLELRPNFDEKETAIELQKQYHCQMLINGGFYTPENEPTGQFISQGKTRKQATSSTLLDGFIVEDGNKVYIGSVPQNDAYWAIQTGPRLFINGQKRRLSLVRDEYARRMVALNTSRNELYFLSIYLAENKFDGPELVNLPEVVDLFAQQLQIRITDAINLDGGSASAFVSSDITLSELTPIGSFFCVK